MPASRTLIRTPQGVALYIGSVLGGGILVLPSLAAGQSGPASLIAWLIVTLFSLPVALLFGMLSAQHPTNGGLSDFGRAAFGQHAGNLAGWLYLFVLPFGQPAVMLSGMYYLAYVLGLPRHTTVLLAFGVITTAVIIALAGKRLAARVQMLIVAAIALILAWTFFIGVPHIQPDHFSPFMPFGISSIGATIALVMWSYIGVENLSFIAEDFENPKRDMVKTVLIGTAIVTVLYLGASGLTIGVLTAHQWATTRAPFAEIALQCAGHGAMIAVTCVGIFIVSASALASIWGGSNLCASLASKNALPSLLAQRTHGTPRIAIVAIWLTYAATFTAILLFGIDIDAMARLVGASTLCTYVMAAASALKLMSQYRFLAWITLVLSGSALPFFGWALLLPATVTMLYVLYSLLTAHTSHSPIPLEKRRKDYDM